MPIKLSKRINSSPPYAFAEVDKAVTNLKNQGIKVIDLGVGDPSSPTPDFVIRELAQAGQRHADSGYPSYIGTEHFRQACADYLHRNFSVRLDPATEICSSIGSKEAVFHFPLAFIDPGEIVICPTPGYPPYKNGTLFAGGIPYFVPLVKENNFLIDFESIPASILKKTRVVWLNYPNSPTGALAPLDYLKRIADWAQTNDIILACDEGCYIDIYYDQKPHSILEMGTKNIITFYSLSKRNNMTCYRVGFCAGDADIIAGFKKLKTNLDSGTPTFIQDTAALALADDQHVQTMRQEYAQKMRLMLQALEQAGLPDCRPASTFYIWQQAPAGVTGVQLAEAFLAQGIVVTPGAWISDQTAEQVNPGENYVRLALVAPLGDIQSACLRLNNCRLF